MRQFPHEYCVKVITYTVSEKPLSEETLKQLALKTVREDGPQCKVEIIETPTEKS